MLGASLSRLDGWRDFMRMTDEALTDGLDMRAQVTPRPIGMLFGLDLWRHGLVYHPSYKKIAHKTIGERVKIMRDPEFRRQILNEKLEHYIKQQVRRVRNIQWQFPFGDPADYAPPKHRSIQAVTDRTAKSVDELTYDLLLEDDGWQMIFSPDNDYGDYTLNACKK